MKRLAAVGLVLSLLTACSQKPSSEIVIPSIVLPTLSDDEAAGAKIIEFNSLMATFQRDFGAYSEARYDWNQRFIQVSGGYDAWLAGVRPGIEPMLRLLSDAKTTYLKLSSLADFLIQDNRIPEVFSGAVDPEDVRRYFELSGIYLDLNRDTVASVGDCVALTTKDEVGACINAYFETIDRDYEQSVLTELDSLSTAIFGQSLNFGDLPK